MRRLKLALAVAAIPLGSVAVASCALGSGPAGTDGGTQRNSIGCAADHSDSSASGTFTSNGGASWALDVDCTLVTPGAGARETWTSAFVDDRGTIRVDVHHDNAVDVGAYWVRDGARTLDTPAGKIARDLQRPSSLRAHGLEWTRTVTPGLSWSEARDACAALTAGGPGWRLPTLDEWLTIATPTDDRVFGEDAWFWTSTAAHATGEAWSVTTAGAINANRSSTRAMARCVR